MYIIIAIIAFGLLIVTHELGHFLAAKACGVRVNEFAVGMGPVIFKKRRGETLYSLRCLPIGGFCAMEGEDEDSIDPRAFTAQAAWKRLLIIVAGAFTNFLMGFIVIVILFSQAAGFVTPRVVSTEEGFPDDGARGIMAGDTIYSINGERVFYLSDFSTLMLRDKDGYVDMVVLRGGEKVRLDGYYLVQGEYPDGEGGTSFRYGISFEAVKADFAEKLKYSCYTAGNFVRLIRFGLADLISGAIGFRDLSGPVGIVSTINDVGQSSASRSAAFFNIAYLCAFVAVNLAVMNMLPIPALDGGRVFFMIITWIIEKISRRRVNPKYEGYIHMAGLVLLMGLMVVVMCSDVVKLIRG